MDDSELRALDNQVLPRQGEKLTHVSKLRPALNFTAGGRHQIASQQSGRVQRQGAGTVKSAEAAR